MPEEIRKSDVGGEDILDIKDIKGILKRSAAEVSIQELIDKGHKTIRVVSSRKVKELINQAVKTVIDRHIEKEVSAEELVKESQREFTELFEQYQHALKAKTTLEESHRGLTEELGELKSELDVVKKVAEGRVSEEEQERLIISLKEFEYRLDAILAKCIEKRKEILKEEGDKEGINLVEQYGAELEDMLKNIYRMAIKELISSGVYFRDRQVQLLEKRIARLYQYISQLEEAIRSLASQKIYSSGQLAQIFERLGITDPQELERKLPILKKILEDNIKLRKELKELENI